MSKAIIRGRLPVDDLANNILGNLGMTDIDWLIIDPLSIGDAYQTLCVLKAFREKHLQPGARLFYVCSDRAAPIVTMFEGAVDVLVGQRLDYNLCYLFAQRYILGPGVPIIMGPAMYADGWLQRLLDAGLITPMHARKLILGLDLDAPLTQGVPTVADRQGAEALAREAGVDPGRSLLIVNHATTARPLPVEAFADVVAAFPGPVFTDTTVAGAELVPGTQPIGIPIAQMVPLAEICGQVLAIRSGVVDLLSNAATQLFTVYPRPRDAQTWVADQAAWVSAYRALTLERMRLVGQAVEHPIFLEPDDETPQISQRIAAAWAATR